MNKPQMILFDYGHTLLYESGLDFLRGEEALFQYIKSNKRGLNPKQVNDFSQELFEKIGTVIISRLMSKALRRSGYSPYGMKMRKWKTPGADKTKK